MATHIQHEPASSQACRTAVPLQKCLLTLIATLLFFPAHVSLAATKTWSGNYNNLWSDSQNWDGGAPVAGDDLVFPSAVANLTNTNDLPAGTVFGSITFTGPGYTLEGNEIGLTGGITNSGGPAVTVNLPITLAAPQTFSAPWWTGSQITFGGDIHLQSHTLTVTNATITGLISGTGGITVTGASTTLTNYNSYTGDTLIQAGGILTIRGDQPLSNVVNSGTLYSDGIIGSLTSSGYVSPYIGGYGLLTVQGNLTLTGGTVSLIVGGTTPGVDQDQIKVTGTADLGTSTSLSVPFQSFKPCSGSFTLLDTSGSAASGHFSGIPEGAIVNGTDFKYQVSYTANVKGTIVQTDKFFTNGGGTGLWSNDANWDCGHPVTGDSVIFTSGPFATTNDLPTSTVYKGVVTRGGWATTIYGNRITLDSGFVGALTINTDVTLAGSQEWAGAVVNGNVDLGASTLTLNSSATVNGAISGAGGLAIISAYLNGTNTYAGPTVLSGGWLALTGSIASSALSGTGSIIGNGTTGPINFGGYISPQDPLTGIPSTLHTGNLTTGALQILVNGPTAGGGASGYSQIDVTGTVTLDPSPTLQFTLGGTYKPSVGTTFTIINNDGADSVTGTFSGLAEGATLTLGTIEFAITYAGGDGNDVVLTCTRVPYVWTGLGFDSLFSNAANWDAGVPTAGADLVFPAGPTSLSPVNDLTAGTVFHSLALTGGGYSLSGNTIGLNAGITGFGTINNDLVITQPQTFTPSSTLLITGNITLGASTLTLSTGSGGVVQISGQITGTGGISSSGAIIVVLSGANTYTGPTQVASWYTEVNGLQPSSPVTLTSGHLQGTGRTGSVNASGGFVAGAQGLSTTPATLHTGDLALGQYATLQAYLNGPGAGTGYSQIDVNGSVLLVDNPVLSASLLSSFNVHTGDQFVLISNDSTDPVTGIFRESSSTILSEGATITLTGAAGGYDFTISYIGGDGNDIVLTCVRAPRIWTGAVNGNWSVAGNWDGGVPATGDELVFPSSASTYVMNNDLPLGTIPKSLRFDGGTYELSGNELQVSDKIFSAGVPSVTLNCNYKFTAIPSGTYCGWGNSSITFNGTVDFSSHDYDLSSGFCSAYYNGNITGTTGALSDSGIVYINGPVSWTGQILNSHTLVMNSSNPHVDVSGGTVAGTGVAGNVASRLAPGPPGPPQTPGVLSTKNLILDPTFTTVMNGPAPGAGGYSQAAVTGTVRIGYYSIGYLSISFGYSPSAGDRYVIINNDGTDAVVGEFSGLPEGTIFPVYGVPGGDRSLQITYAGDATTPGAFGNDVVLTVLPRTLIWQGGDGSAWSGTYYWTPYGYPAGGDTLVFPAENFLTSTANNDMPAFLPLETITFTGYNYDLAGNGIGLKSGILACNTSGSNSISADLRLFNAAQAFTVDNALTSLDITGGIDTNGFSLTIAGVGNLSSSGSMTGAGSLTKTGSGILNLSGSNTYTGVTAITGGSLVVKNNNALGLSTSGTVVNQGGEMILDDGITVAVEPLTLNGTGVSGSGALRSITGTTAWNGPVTLGPAGATIAVDTGLMTLGGSFVGSGNLTKSGNGTLIISGTSTTFTGTISATAGHVVMQGSASSSTIIIGNGATLVGAGVAGSTTVQSGGTVSPGSSPAILTTGSLSMAAGSTLVIELDGGTPGSGYDQLKVNGSVALGNATLSLTLGYTPSDTQTFVIIDNDLTDPVTGAFDGLPEGTFLTLNGNTYLITYQGGNGNDVVLCPVMIGTPSVSTLSGGSCGFRVSWTASVCTRPLTYSIYRSTTSGFTPSASNLIAKCVSGGSYEDSTDLADGTTYYYAVRAEDASSGQGGACNGGQESQNTASSASAQLTCVGGGGTPQPVQFFSVTSRDSSNILQWVNPASVPVSPFNVRMRSRTDGSWPGGPADGTNEGTVTGQMAGTKASQTLTATNGTEYRYGVFTDNNAGSVFSAGRYSKGTPFSLSGTAETWRYSTGASALTPPGINSWASGNSALAVSNDRILHAMNGVAVTGAGAGEWPPSFTPAVMNAPSQSRPIVVPMMNSLTPGHDRVIFLGAQDGRVYAFDPTTGASIWDTGATPLAESIQGGIVGTFTAFGESENLLFVGTRNVTSDNKFYALDPRTGAGTRVVWSFDNGGGTNGFGIVSGSASADSSSGKVYFLTRAKPSGSSATVWCVSISDGKVCSGFTPRALGDFDSSPILWSGKLFVGNNEGRVYRLDPATGASDTAWPVNPYVTSDGPVKGFVWPDPANNRIFFSTANKVWALKFTNGDLIWQKDLTGKAPSGVLYLNGRLYVGLNDGNLMEIDAATPASIKQVLLEPSTGIGAPGFDYFNNLIYVGTESGTVHAVSVPLP